MAKLPKPHTGPAFQKGNGMILPEPKSKRKGFAKGVTGNNIDVADSPDDEYMVTIGSHNRSVRSCSSVPMRHTEEEIENRHKYNQMMGRTSYSWLYDE